MISPNDTAYPRFPRVLTDRDLEDFFTPADEELAFVIQSTAHDLGLCLSCMLLLKGMQYLNYLPEISDIPLLVVNHIRIALSMDDTVQPGYPNDKTKYRHHKVVRDYLGVVPYAHPTVAPLLHAVLHRAAQQMSDPGDLINLALAELLLRHYELPAFSTLERMVERVRDQVHNEMFRQIDQHLAQEDKQKLDQLLVSAGHAQLSELFQIKKPAGPASVSQMREIYRRLVYLETLLPTRTILAGLHLSKIMLFASEAEVLDASRMAETRSTRKYALLVCLLHEAQMRARDDLIEMYLRRLRLIHKHGKEALAELHRQQQAMTEALVELLHGITYRTAEIEDDALLGQGVRELLKAAGGSEAVLANCEAIAAHRDNNYLPLLYRFYRQHRSLLFESMRLLQPRTTSGDHSLADALTFVLNHQGQTREWWEGTLDLQFASQRWRQMIVGQIAGKPALKRRMLEVCVFTYVAYELNSGDLYVPGSHDWSDPHAEFLPWAECEPLVPEYCARLGFDPTPHGFTAHLKDWLAHVAREADRSFPENGQLSINAKGEFVLKRITARKAPLGAARLREALEKDMPERHILDILHNVFHWTSWSRHWGPRSGHGGGLKNPTLSYLMTTFCYGCNLGPAQTARHTRHEEGQNRITPRMMSHVNYQHVTAEKLDYSVGDIIDLYHRFELTHYWGSGKAAGADGTLIEIYHHNLQAQYHGRYRRVGGIAYHYVGDTYAALFTEFITCGVREGIYLLDLFYKLKSDVHPDTLHADTHGQSTVIFGLAYLLGIQLMPRIRNWQDLVLFRPDKSATYDHIDALFGDPIDWRLIEYLWQDYLQVALSIEQRRVLPSSLLRRLGHHSRKNRLYQAFRELGRVIRTIFLLRYISEPPFRHEILDMTNKVEAYHHFKAWLAFGSEGIIKHNDPVEQAKRLKYNDLVANAVMVQNVVDMTRLLRQFDYSSFDLSPEVLAVFSPYLTHHIKRFGEYVVNFKHAPDPLDPQTWSLPLVPPDAPP